MKKLLFLAVLLGLTGCGETDQNDTSQATLQSPVTASAMQVNYRMAASPSAMSASAASFGGWNPLGLKPVGASSLLNASKTLGGIATDSHALITPAVKDVTKVLVRGAGGLALSVAVEELLGAVDWVMDPTNNQIKYKVPIDPTQPPCVTKFYYQAGKTRHCTAFDAGRSYCSDYIQKGVYATCQVTGVNAYNSFAFYKYSYPEFPTIIKSSSVSIWETQGPIGAMEEKTLPLDVVSQKIIDNAQSGNADAQAVTLAAAQAILSEAENDAEKAKAIEDELERNADPKCSSHNAYMNGQASIIELRYNELKVDKLFLYRDYFKISTPHPSGYGSWEGHVQRYKFEQGVLKNLIVTAFLDGCPETLKARDWKDKPAPTKPDYAM